MKKFKYTDPTNSVVARIDDDDKIRFSCAVTHPEFVGWLAAGNTPEPADPEPEPVDQSDLDQLQKQMKAVLLCVAQVGGLTVPQIKAMFKNKMDALP